MPVIINPGTEGRQQTTEENAVKIAMRIAREIDRRVERYPGDDVDGGFYGFIIHKGDGTTIEVQIPGDDPDQFFMSRPFVSRRMYVDGSSWLWRYAAGIIEDRLAK